MIPVPRDVLSNTADTIIGCTTSANQEGIRFSELGKFYLTVSLLTLILCLMLF